jgi:CHAT domain-containing protein
MYDDNGRPLALDPNGKVIALQMVQQQQQQQPVFVQGLPQQLPAGFRPYLDQQGHQVYDNVGQPLAYSRFNRRVVSLQFQQV